MKLAYVGALEGEITITAAHTHFVVGIDLCIPRVPLFTLKVPFEHLAPDRTNLFKDMVHALQVEVVGFLLGHGVEQQAVDTLYHSMEAALTKAGASPNDSKADRSGSADPLLEQISNLEPLEVFEVKFELPENFTKQLHQHVVTATQKVTLPQQGAGMHLPKNVGGSPYPKTLQQNYPSVRNLIRKFKPQQGKPLAGPAFVLVYDVQGRPVGVRSIKAPNWSWLKKAKLFQRKPEFQLVNQEPPCKK